MIKEKFSWKNGVNFPVDAQVAAEVIRVLQTNSGKDFVTPKELLDASRDEKAPLHSCFTWDDTVAAEKWRVHEAGCIIRGIEIEVVIEKDESSTTTTPVRAFVNVAPTAPGKQGKYVPFQTAMETPEHRKIVLKAALNELLSFKRKYEIYKELEGVNKAIDIFADTLNDSSN